MTSPESKDRERLPITGTKIQTFMPSNPIIDSLNEVVHTGTKSKDRRHHNPTLIRLLENGKVIVVGFSSHRFTVSSLDRFAGDHVEDVTLPSGILIPMTKVLFPYGVSLNSAVGMQVHDDKVEFISTQAGTSVSVRKSQEPIDTKWENISKYLERIDPNNQVEFKKNDIKSALKSLPKGEDVHGGTKLTDLYIVTDPETNSILLLSASSYSVNTRHRWIGGNFGEGAERKIAVVDREYFEQGVHHIRSRLLALQISENDNETSPTVTISKISEGQILHNTIAQLDKEKDTSLMTFISEIQKISDLSKVFPLYY